MPARVIDADGLILGRLASKVAKMLLMGEKIIVVNAEKAVISGQKRHNIKNYHDRSQIHTHTNPRRGPFWPKTPNNFVRRTIRGMLPWKKNRGRTAYKNLKVFMGVPEDLNLEVSTFETFSDASLDHLKGNFMLIGDLVKEIGWKSQA